VSAGQSVLLQHCELGIQVPWHAFVPLGHWQLPFWQVAPPPQSASVQQLVVGMQEEPHSFEALSHGALWVVCFFFFFFLCFLASLGALPMVNRPTAALASPRSAWRREGLVDHVRSSASNRSASTDPPP
jgi:hypothetical protein